MGMAGAIILAVALICANSAQSHGARVAKNILDGFGDIAPGLPRPQALQGHDDENYPIGFVPGPDGVAAPGLAKRYANLAPLKPGIRRYNIWWNSFESNARPSAPTAAQLTRGGATPCPAGTVQTPANASDGAARGYHRFHCYREATLKRWDTILAADQAIGAQNAAILYAAPRWAIHPNCTGFTFGTPLRIGCAPWAPDARGGRAAALDDYEDYVTLLAERWLKPTLGNARGLGLRHWVVWNEVASCGWFDNSPLVPNRAGPGGADPLTPAQFDFVVATYAALVRRTASAVARQARCFTHMLLLHMHARHA